MNGATARYYCPLSSCPWMHDAPADAEIGFTFSHWPNAQAEAAADPKTLTFGDLIHETTVKALLAHALGQESVIRAHLETHTLEEWVREVMRLRERKPDANTHADLSGLLRGAQDLQFPVPDKARLGRALTEGRLSQNDVRWVYLAAAFVERVAAELEPGALRSSDDLPEEPPLFTTRRLFAALEKRVERLEQDAAHLASAQIAEQTVRLTVRWFDGDGALVDSVEREAIRGPYLQAMLAAFSDRPLVTEIRIEPTGRADA